MAQYVDLMGGGADPSTGEFYGGNIGSVAYTAQNYGPRGRGDYSFAGGMGSAAYSAQTFGQAIGVEKLDDINTNTLIGKMNYLVTTITGMTKKILTTTAVGIKELIRRSAAEMEFNKSNYIGMVLAQTSPIFGYFAAKFMESDVFADFAQRIKDRLGAVLDWVKIKYLMPLWMRLTGGRGFTLRGIAQIPFRALGIIVDAAKWMVKLPIRAITTTIKEIAKIPFRALGLGLRVLSEIAKLPWRALGLAVGGIAKLITMPFKLLGLPFKALGGLFDAFKWGWHWGRPPKAAAGGYVRREGLIHAHPGEIIAPKGALEEAISPVVSVLEDIKQSIGKNIGFFVRLIAAQLVPTKSLFPAGIKGWAMGTKLGRLGLGAYSAMSFFGGGEFGIPERFRGGKVGEAYDRMRGLSGALGSSPENPMYVMMVGTTEKRGSKNDLKGAWDKNSTIEEIIESHLSSFGHTEESSEKAYTQRKRANSIFNWLFGKGMREGDWKTQSRDSMIYLAEAMTENYVLGGKSPEDILESIKQTINKKYDSRSADAKESALKSMLGTEMFEKMSAGGYNTTEMMMAYLGTQDERIRKFIRKSKSQRANTLMDTLEWATLGLPWDAGKAGVGLSWKSAGQVAKVGWNMLKWPFTKRGRDIIGSDIKDAHGFMKDMMYTHPMTEGMYNTVAGWFSKTPKDSGRFGKRWKDTEGSGDVLSRAWNFTTTAGRDAWNASTGIASKFWGNTAKFVISGGKLMKLANFMGLGMSYFVNTPYMKGVIKRFKTIGSVFKVLALPFIGIGKLVGAVVRNPAVLATALFGMLKLPFKGLSGIIGQLFHLNLFKNLGGNFGWFIGKAARVGGWVAVGLNMVQGIFNALNKSKIADWMGKDPSTFKPTGNDRLSTFIGTVLGGNWNEGKGGMMSAFMQALSGIMIGGVSGGAIGAVVGGIGGFLLGYIGGQELTLRSAILLNHPIAKYIQNGSDGWAGAITGGIVGFAATGNPIGAIIGALAGYFGVKYITGKAKLETKKKVVSELRDTGYSKTLSTAADVHSVDDILDLQLPKEDEAKAIEQFKREDRQRKLSVLQRKFKDMTKGWNRTSQEGERKYSEASWRFYRELPFDQAWESGMLDNPESYSAYSKATGMNLEEEAAKRRREEDTNLAFSKKHGVKMAYLQRKLAEAKARGKAFDEEYFLKELQIDPEGAFHSGGLIKRLHSGGNANDRMSNEVDKRLKVGEWVLNEQQVRGLRDMGLNPDMAFGKVKGNMNKISKGDMFISASITRNFENFMDWLSAPLDRNTIKTQDGFMTTFAQAFLSAKDDWDFYKGSYSSKVRESLGGDIFTSIEGAVNNSNFPMNELSGGVWDSLILKYAAKYNVNPNIIRAMIMQESGGDPNAVSGAGAVGLMQLMKGTADDLGVKDRTDPEESIRGGTQHFAYLLKKYKGNVHLALAAYNAGEGRVNRSGGIPNLRETQDYVKIITGRLGLPVPQPPIDTSTVARDNFNGKSVNNRDLAKKNVDAKIGEINLGNTNNTTPKKGDKHAELTKALIVNTIKNNNIIAKSLSNISAPQGSRGGNDAFDPTLAAVLSGELS